MIGQSKELEKIERKTKTVKHKLYNFKKVSSFKFQVLGRLVKAISSIFVFLAVFYFLLTANNIQAGGASLYLSPSKGTFLAGNTFGVSIYVNTKENKINAVEIDLRFPSDILQVTSPTAGESFISEWFTPPNYSNIGGKVSFKGGIPDGIVTSAGLVSTITFRAKSPGVAKIEILDSSRVLLADGKGTPVYPDLQQGVYEILVAPPEGPKISSPSHPDSDIWYANSSPIFFWERNDSSDFSFIFSQSPNEVPDTVSEGNADHKSYNDVSDGVWYFHLRSKQQGTWGQVSHFAVKIDITPPQGFESEIDTKYGFVYFKTQDFHSGIDYYEVSVLDIDEVPSPSPFFVESVSPFKSPFKTPGKYSVIVKAYDRAGNWKQEEARFRMFSPTFSYIEGKGVEIKGFLFAFPLILFFIFILTGSVLGFVFYFARRRTGLEKGIKEIEEAIREIEKIKEKEKGIQELKRKFELEKTTLEQRLQNF